MSRFSIVIPVYKTKEYLDHCVESVIPQSFSDFEIILVDDGSPDCCGEMCDAWAVRDSRIKVIHQENGGLSAARNTGVRHASGDYVMFLDSDDWWADDQVLEQIAEHLERTDADVLSCNYRKSYNGTLEPLYFPAELPHSEATETIAQMMRLDLWVTGACNKTIRRTLLTENKLYFRTGITSEDIDWTLRLALHGEKFAFANVCVFIYRQIASSISHNMSQKKIGHLCDNVCECVRLLDESDPEKAKVMQPFVAYQYGTLLHNVALLPAAQRSAKLMAGVREMKWLLNCSDNNKVRLLRISSRFGLPMTFMMLRLRQKLLDRSGKGV